MIDFHSHVLPGMDDGSRDTDESLELLERSAQQGVAVMAMTPHFYGHRESPKMFLNRRREAMERLSRCWADHHPKLLAGAEVCYFPGFHRAETLLDLRLEGTPYFLLEMPFGEWTERMIDEVLELNRKPDVQVVLAHIDRYPRAPLEQLLAHGVKFQVNADSFLSWRQRRGMLNMLRRGWISFLGSDCHNLTTRAPNLEDAMAVIRKKAGADALAKLGEAQLLNYIGAVHE